MRTDKIDGRKCAKQEILAIIISKKGEYFIGSNWCENPQTVCPRKDMKTGEGYDLCQSICKQPAHAEVDACQKAGEKAKGSTLLLIGHYYCCDNCKIVMAAHGVQSIKILSEFK